MQPNEQRQEVGRYLLVVLADHPVEVVHRVERVVHLVVLPFALVGRDLHKAQGRVVCHVKDLEREGCVWVSWEVSSGRAYVLISLLLFVVVVVILDVVGPVHQVKVLVVVHFALLFCFFWGGRGRQRESESVRGSGGD